MNTENSGLIEEHCPHPRPRVCWSAIFTGAFIGVGLGFLLHLFSIAIGLSAYSSTSNGATVIAIGGILGLLIGVIVSMGLAGFVAGYLGRFHYCHCHGGVIYGFLTWSIALLLSAVFVIPLTHYISTYTRNLAPAIVTNQVAQTLDESTVANEATPSVKNKQATTTQPIPTESEKNVLAWSAWVVFILFFIGALASCIGACLGMGCKRNHEIHHSDIDDTDVH
ncbi:DUF4199 domain-containing protein [Legionella hackeliae]|uniref:Transmembrane protein n=1 Tax=Legionella hackeliae TaxID=449 RepID=A0A0A8UWA6_LEGHA|nr:DUF4199 domain-containing protein [Legionella hackeliae]KTD12420.1 hypothetical protein Lhac_1291 [Legionella hackeliae]CEK11831.1 conserved membrane protein of unknown function [Legionella hackeliae]STX48597.1 Uncharacterised protein [Legionella hackeliae]